MKKGKRWNKDRTSKVPGTRPGMEGVALLTEVVLKRRQQWKGRGRVIGTAWRARVTTGRRSCAPDTGTAAEGLGASRGGEGKGGGGKKKMKEGGREKVCISKG